MNLAEQVRQFYELKKAYEAKQEMLTKSFQDGIDEFFNSDSCYSEEDKWFIERLKRTFYGAIRKNQNTIYMLESINPRNYSEEDFLSYVTIFRGFPLKFGYNLAKSQGLLVEVVDLQLMPPDNVKEHSYTRTDEWCFEYYKLPQTVKALKITWGDK
jgi:hypothetical protein